MKFSKKITVMLLLGMIISSNVLLEGSNSFADNTNKAEISYYENISDISNSKEQISIKKIKLDSSGKPVSSEFVDQKQYKSGLSDGIYTIDRGDGWILGKDRGFIKSIIVPKGASGVLSTIKEVGYKESINTNMSVSFGPQFIKATLKAGYGESFGENKTEEIYKTIKTSNGKNLFVKVQGVYRNVEVIKVKNGQITDSAKTFTPSAHTFSSLEFGDNEIVNQAELYERSDRCILGDPGYDIKNIRDQNAQYHSKVLNVVNANTDYATLDKVKQNKHFGVYFTVPESRKYEIKDMMYYKFVFENSGYGAGMKLYKVDKYNDNDIELMSSVPANFRSNNYGFDHNGDASYRYFKGEGITADLKTGEKYLLMLNEDMRIFWNDKNGIPLDGIDIQYRIQFNKK